VPSRYRHLERLTIRYARWSLEHVYLVDPRTGQVLSRLLPLDRARNADGVRRPLEPLIAGEPPAPDPQEPGVAPLLQNLMADYAATGLPPAYLPKDERSLSPPRGTTS
jgi:hypothetical protein